MNSGENDICNIIYRSDMSKKKLARYYMLKMKRSWKSSYNKEFFHNDMGYWMTFKKNNKQCLVSIIYSEDIQSNIVSIYYGYKE